MLPKSLPPSSPLHTGSEPLPPFPVLKRQPTFSDREVSVSDQRGRLPISSPLDLLPQHPALAHLTAPRLASMSVPVPGQTAAGELETKVKSSLEKQLARGIQKLGAKTPAEARGEWE